VGSRAGGLILEMIQGAQPDLVCLTECHRDFLGDASWHLIAADADHGYPVVPGRTKVGLWSRQPWTEVTTDLEGAPPGRFVSGLTDTPLGRVRVLGVCGPWEAAHVSAGRRDRTRWQDHIAFLGALLA